MTLAPTNFGHTEIGPNLGQTAALQAAIDAATAFDGSGFFRDVRKLEHDVLCVAHRLLVELKTGGKAALDAAFSAFPMEGRQRRPSRKKLELFVVELTLKPTTEAQRKICSDLAAVLVVAHANMNEPEWFEASLRDLDVKTCKTRAACLRAIAKRGNDEQPGPTPLEATPNGWIELRCGERGSTTAKARLVVDQDHFKIVATFVQQAAEATAFLQHLVDRLAERRSADDSAQQRFDEHVPRATLADI